MTIHNQSSSEIHKIQLDFALRGNASAGGFFSEQSDSSPLNELPLKYSVSPSIHNKAWRWINLDTSNVDTLNHDDDVRILRFFDEPNEIMEAIPVMFRIGELKEVVATFRNA